MRLKNTVNRNVGYVAWVFALVKNVNKSSCQSNMRMGVLMTRARELGAGDSEAHRRVGIAGRSKRIFVPAVSCTIFRLQGRQIKQYFIACILQMISRAGSCAGRRARGKADGEAGRGGSWQEGRPKGGRAANGQAGRQASSQVARQPGRPAKGVFLH